MRFMPGLLLFTFLFDASTASAGRDNKPPTAPTNLRVTALRPSSVTLAWNASTDNSGSVKYAVHRTPLNGSDYWSFMTTQTTGTDTGLRIGRTYRYVVYATDPSQNWSAASNTVTITTPQDVTPPSAPTVSLVDVNPTRVALTWPESSDDDAVGSYQVFVDGVLATGVTWPGLPAGTRYTIVGQLTQGVTYTIEVRARDRSGNLSGFSNPVSATPGPSADHTPPGTPQFSTLDGCDEVNFTWAQVTDDTSGQGLITYRIYDNGVVADAATVIGLGRTLEYFDATIGHTFHLESVDFAGNRSALSNPVFVPACF